MDEKVEQLVDMILEAKHIVVHTGAGISTSCGIPDFRGPTGVWTLEKKGIKPTIDISFENAIPSKTHRALKLLVERGYVKYIISQNIDGLHMRSGVSREYLAEMHGNMFIAECPKCRTQFIRSHPVPTVGKKSIDETCQNSLRPCRGQMIDNILDWEHDLPEDDLDAALMHSTLADLNIGLGSSFQIMPSGRFPLKNKKFGGKFALVNLQPIKLEKQADLVIHTYVDDVLQKVLKRLGIEDIPEFNIDDDPTKKTSVQTWNIPKDIMKDVEQSYKLKTSRKGRKTADEIVQCKKIKKTEN